MQRGAHFMWRSRCCARRACSLVWSSRATLCTPHDAGHHARGVATAAGRATHVPHPDPSVDRQHVHVLSSAPGTVLALSPQSSLAYRASLHKVRFDSLLELRQLPYAPGPLQVLADALAYATAVQGEMNSENETAVRPSTEEPTLEQRHARLRKALSRTSDVCALLQEACEGVREAVSAANEVGDVESERERRVAEEEMERFADLVLRESTDAVPDPVRIALLRGLLELAELTGTHALAVTVLDRLLVQSESAVRRQTRHDSNLANDDQVLSVDELPAVLQSGWQNRVWPVRVDDHLAAMRSCARNGAFGVAASLYARLVQHAEAGAFRVQANDFTTALIALAQCCRSAADYAELRELITRSEATAVVPVSVPLYTALIDAVARPPSLPQRLPIALALYRRLRDGGLSLTAHTYAALIACCAAAREPTRAFAFYHEARACCRVESFPPHLYASLLHAYAAAGYGADAHTMLDVLVEAGAPLTRNAFDAVLRSAVSLRAAREVMAVMTTRYHIAPTPHSYAHLVRVAATRPAGAQTVLQLYDLHELACAAVGACDVRTPSVPTTSAHDAAKDKETAEPRTELESVLRQRYPDYVHALEHALLRVRVDLELDSRLRPYAAPLLRVVQQDMNDWIGLCPQAPTQLPERAQSCIAVLAPDVLLRVEEWVVPFMASYSALVIPYSALAALRESAAWQTDLTNDTLAHGQTRLRHFLRRHRDVVHLLSLEEELRCSRELARYGVGVGDVFARCAGLALHLARDTSSAPGHVSYAALNARVVLVSTRFTRCGRYVVRLKQHYKAHAVTRATSLAAALTRVYYHNPSTQPEWTPPTHSAAELTALPREQRVGESRGAADVVREDCAALPSAAARALYARHVRRNSDFAPSPPHAAAADLDTDTLMSMLAEDAA